VTLPPTLEHEVGASPFVGRQDVIARVRRRYAAADQGTPQFVVLCGEPGIGKTRLAAEIAGAAHAEGATVLYGRSDRESLVPYQPFIGALEHYLGHHRAGDLAFELGPG
jgi:predicted ATPase